MFEDFGKTRTIIEMILTLQNQQLKPLAKIWA